MKILHTRKLLTIAVLVITVSLGAGVRNSYAAPVTLHDLVTVPGAKIEIGDLRFSNWTLSQNLNGNLSEISVSSINVDPLNPGLRYSFDPALVVSSSNEVQLKFQYDLTTLSGDPIIKDHSLGLTDYSVTEGTTEQIIIEQDALNYDNPDFGISGDWHLFVLDDRDLTPTPGEGIVNRQLFDSGDFTDPVNEAKIWNWISMRSWSGTPSLDLTEYEQNFSLVPIPGAVWLLGSGLIGLVALRRKYKN